MTELFGDLLNRAETVTDCRNTLSESGDDYRKLDGQLQNIFRASEHLWKLGEVHPTKSLLFGVDGISFVRPESGSTFSLSDMSVIEQADDREREEADRAFFNHVLSQATTSDTIASPAFDKTSAIPTQFSELTYSRNYEQRSLVFAEKLKKYLISGKKRNISQLLVDAANVYNNVSLTSVWSDVKAMLDEKISTQLDDMSTVTKLLSKACDYLHALFIAHMKNVVERNLEFAERGGVPGTKGLVEAYLKLADERPFVEDNDDIALWEVVFYCFRAGDISTAQHVLRAFSNDPQCAVLLKAVGEVESTGKIDSETKNKLKMEWRHVSHALKDEHKKGLYAAFLGLDSCLADSLENWLWFKLIALRLDSQMTPVLYNEIQKVVSIDYGEGYFMRNGPADLHLYLTALILSSQFERAIEVLFKNGHIVDAVHIAIIAREQGLLRVCEDVRTSGLIEEDPVMPTKCRLNFVRLIVTYTKDFEIEDSGRAMDYWFLLKGLKTASGVDLFEKAVSRLVYLKDNVELVFGTFDHNGERTHGLVDGYPHDIPSLLRVAAADATARDDVMSAVRLYLLAKDHPAASALLANELSKLIRSRSKDVDVLYQQAIEFANRKHVGSADDYATLYTLIDIYTAMKNFEAGHVDRGLDIVNQLRVIPTDPDTFMTFSAQTLPPQVRDTLPELCLSVMRCCIDAINSSTTKQPVYEKQVRAIMLFAASLDEKMPQHVISQLLRLQATLS